VIEPWGAIVVGIVAGFVSVAGYVFVQPFLQRAIGLHDTCGVHNLHGMPGILGGIAGMISAMTAGEEKYGQSISTVFPKRANGRRYVRACSTFRTFYLYTNSQSNCLEYKLYSS
jgi:ammonium transporter Rh